MKKQKIIVILGQTATGKSNLAVKIAKKIDGEVISADSRQVYKNLNIGTGKITKKEMKGVPHHLLDVVDPKKKFTVAEYQKLAISAIAEIVSRDRIPIICGGTGFYIDAITKGIVFPEVLPNPKLRKTLHSKSAIALFEYLKKLDPRRAEDIKNKNEQNNKIRLVRAIEIAKALGKVPELKYDTNSAMAKNVSSYKFIKIGLYLPPDKLKKKIEKRVKKMFQDKLLKEIKSLKKSGVAKKRLKEFGFEYDSPTYEKMVKETIKYTKRQMTWFKRDKEIKWFDASKKNLFAYVSSVLHALK
ncbi:MAG: tRNA dimethylallyltransferase [Candidatus Nomurabacteria bacterium GW2011_GWF2_35_12]|uniref:tRNA dimethylallyltransferase n=1 Tax=Candidatus Nomurabacteria bacterium GW2011_GWA2_35_80 TaxID=1618733 RepID=A0A0G0D466_9BACT|nr:MAG: tRNA dimethylallyltransferase [Candidatus Nomurabacteria bacterium GW2011_GWF2_35_12]KKP76444.1 MAG: tRNA dimethylallyltransferase [Parcubacteria group bacterium GW2011_GWC1_35_21]KKP78140.1 MAG: tRNA dimethylallyltransferase [Candidatus Nomurabacteria bacterium GW2011_GWC2_35_35]KKP84632.1 MAG: tRNA dimethylallyltransferase [Parcubacteria group bacterium GW2011_GWD2_35_7]KKP88098.1 MAG: tRNA dimethylallyltransferase [Candidatus Nomurabacteria bacterium GW2011_GWA2_35_80]HCY18031.1 tRN